MRFVIHPARPGRTDDPRWECRVVQELPCRSVFALLRVFDLPVAEDVQVMAEVGMMVDEPLPTAVVARRQIKIDWILLPLGRWFARAVVRDGPRHSDVDDRAEEKEYDELGKTAFHDIILRRSLSPPPHTPGKPHPRCRAGRSRISGTDPDGGVSDG